MKSTDEIAEQILARRRDVISALFKGPAGEELVRLETAFKALTGKEPPSVADVLSGSRHRVAQIDERLGISDEAQVPVPVKSAARDLMASTDRPWTYDAMLEHWKTEGVVFDVKNLRDALRTAMLQLMEEGMVERVDRGIYRPVRDPWDTANSADGDGGEW